MTRISTLVVCVLAAGAGIAAAQHTDHQRPATDGVTPSQQVVAACIQSQKDAAIIAARLDRRLEAARQTNSPAEMRAAMGDLQAGLTDIEAALRSCDALKASAASPDPHAGHKTPPQAPVMQPGTTKPDPEAVQPKTPEPVPAEAIDPVCGMKVNPKSGPSAVYEGKTYYFCSESDRQRFLKDPATYIKK